MNLRARKEIHETAKSILDRSPNIRRILLIYIGISLGLSLITAGFSLFFSNQIAGTGGLGNIGLRSILSTGQSVLPWVQMIVNACLGLGYHIAILCIVRNFEATPQTLLSGFRNFFPMLRLLLIQGFLYFGVLLAAAYLSSFIFLATPFSRPFMELMEPMLSSLSVMDQTLVLDEATLLASMETMIPMFYIMIPVLAILLIPLFYKLRMATFALADEPRRGALHALSKSRFLMRRNRFALFRLDLTMWWFYLGELAIGLVCYGDMLLPLLGISLPFSATASYYIFFLLSMLMQVALYYFCMNRVYTVYAVAYDALQEERIKPLQM